MFRIYPLALLIFILPALAEPPDSRLSTILGPHTLQPIPPDFEKRSKFAAKVKPCGAYFLDDPSPPEETLVYIYTWQAGSQSFLSIENSPRRIFRTETKKENSAPTTEWKLDSDGWPSEILVSISAADLKEAACLPRPSAPSAY